MSIYKTTPDNPFHISIAAIPITEDGKVMCHYFKQKYKFENIYRLFVESIEEGESIEECLHRGLMEEAGIKAEIIRFIGSRNPVDTWFKEIDKPTPVQKTIVYFLVKPLEINLKERKQGDVEADSEIVTLALETLKAGFASQYQRYGLEEFNEVEVLERVRKYI